MPSYRCLLVLLLAASTVTPVLSADPPPVEAPTQVKPARKFPKIGWGTGIKALIMAGLVTYSVVAWTPKPIKQPPPPSAPPSAPPSTSGTQIESTVGTPVTQQTYVGPSTNPPSVNPSSVTSRNARREARLLRRLSNARSFSDNNRRTSSAVDLMSRADLGEALSLLSRMLDKLD